MPDLSARDELDIHRLKFDYAWACDNGDWTLLRSVFTDDAHLVVSNFRVDLDDDAAQVRSMFHCTAQLPGAERPIATGGYYHEVYVRTGSGWRIQRLLEDNRWMTS